jgi:polar amino acid transport system substrate-binding protein
MARARAVRLPIIVALAAGSILAACGSSSKSSSASASPGAGAAPATPAVSAACSAIAKTHPTLAGKTFNVGIAPTIPGYESIDPSNPSKIVGFDVDFFNAVTKCAGITYKFSSADFQALVPSLQAKRVDLVISNLIASPARAQQVDFVIYQKDEEALLVKKGNPKSITSVQGICGNSIATFPGTVQQGAAKDQSAKCVAAGQKPIRIDTYNDFNGCVQAVITGRSDVAINPVSVVEQTAAKFPNDLSATPPIPEFRSLIGIAFNKSSTDVRDATLAAVKAVQADGQEAALFTQWKQDPGNVAPAQLLP